MYREILDMKNLIRVIFAITLMVFLASCYHDKPNQKKPNQIMGTPKQGDTASNLGNGSAGQTGGGTDTGNDTAKQNENSNTGTGTPNQGGNSSGKENGSTNQSGENSNTGADTENPISINSDELLEKYGITRGDITASEAARTLKANIDADKNFKDIVFKTVDIISYDDKQGSFTVKAEFGKNNTFSVREFKFENFTHPLQDTYLSAVESSDLNFDAGIEDNLTAATFVEEANKNIANFFKNGLKFRLASNAAGGNGNNTSVELGEHSRYTLRATLKVVDNSASEQNKKIKIVPVYSIKYHTQLSPEQGSSVSESPAPISQLGNVLEKQYFNEDDVFKYILNKTNETFIKADRNKFASEFYAKVKVTNRAIAELFDMDKIKKYVDLYEKDGGHLKIEKIDAAIQSPRNDGINADDYNGTLTVVYYIATKEIIDDIQTNNPNAKKVTTKEITVGNFKQINEETARQLFRFALIKNLDKNTDGWNNLATLTNKSLLVKKGNADTADWYVIENDLLKIIQSKGYNLVLNDEEVKPELLSNSFLLKGNGDVLLLVENIMLNKQPRNDTLKLTMQFKSNTESSSTPIHFEITPTR